MDATRIAELTAGRSVTVQAGGQDLDLLFEEPSAVEALPRVERLLAGFAAVRDRSTAYLWEWDADGTEDARERAAFLAALVPTTLAVTGAGGLVLHYEDIDERYLMDGYWPAVHLDAELAPVEVTIES
ncbi:hypothetical protein ACIRBX_33675 [Kitasatospora sp. NPDC096147]|uniref:hypothetical protein n=1 Tax=Kitasatospora sp. NPDC096147 TaxID=3364093 RepID=UPI0037FFC6BC